MSRHKCLILGASGLVGQRLQQRLANHPMFEIGAVAGSNATSGSRVGLYSMAIRRGAAKFTKSLTILNANSTKLE